MSSNTGRNIQKSMLVKVQIANKNSNRPSYRITIPNLGTSWYRRIIHDNGKIELIPVEVLDMSYGVSVEKVHGMKDD